MPQRSRLIVVGGSAGAIPVVRRLAADLPADLPADLLVCIHLSPVHPSDLAAALGRASAIPVQFARHGQLLSGGRILLAPPDRHLLVRDDGVVLSLGPRENLSRPAIDPLFRTAVAAWGDRVIGVVLSGRLDDGAAGLSAVKRAGGIAIVQDPNDAEQGEMPRSALAAADADHVVAAADLAGLLVGLVHDAPTPAPARLPADVAAESRADLDGYSSVDAEDGIGARTPLTCPECGGVLWSVDGRQPRFRCHNGHAFSQETMDVAQRDALEGALWSAVRIHQERIELARRMVSTAISHGNDRMAETWQHRAEDYARNADIIRSLLLRSSPDKP